MSLILVVDDEPTLVATLTFNLEREGYEVITASDDGQAQEAARESSPDLVILDLMLGEMHGFEVCRTLRKSPTSRSSSSRRARTKLTRSWAWSWAPTTT